MKMVWGPADDSDPNVVKKNWPGWLEKQTDDPGSPWMNKRMVPDNFARLYHYFLCPSTTAYRRFMAHRDAFTRAGNYESNRISPLSKPFDGVYHDIGVTFLGGKCFRCDRSDILMQNLHLPVEQWMTLDELHDHFTAESRE
ncbi:MAG: hypothetical protein GX444_09780 [Myxococcales bacterium]|nr:hypothetical protein [Myxococcales bacterium]